jgi:hypothetical protein
MIRDEIERNVRRDVISFDWEMICTMVSSGRGRLYNIGISERGCYGLKDGCIVVHLQAMQYARKKDHLSLPQLPRRRAMQCARAKVHTISYQVLSKSSGSQSNESLSLPLHVPRSPLDVIAISTVGNKPPQAPQVATPETSSADHNVDHDP